MEGQKIQPTDKRKKKEKKKKKSVIGPTVAPPRLFCCLFNQGGRGTLGPFQA